MVALDVLAKLEQGYGRIDPADTLRRLRPLVSPIDRGERSFEYGNVETSYWKHLKTRRISTGFPTLDRTLLGGLGSGELGVVVAPYKSGKTSVLVSLGASAVLSGHRVFHVSGELGKWQMLHRYDLRLSGCTSEELMQRQSRIKAARKRVVEAGGWLQVRDSAHERITPLKLERMIERLPELPDLIIVDYIGLMRADREYSGEHGRRAELGELARELRRVAALFGRPVWTAAQANREASRLGTFSGTEIGEDISILQTCDVGVCFICTPKMREQGRGVLTIDGQRIGYEYDREIPLTVDFRRMLILEREAKDGAQ